MPCFDDEMNLCLEDSFKPPHGPLDSNIYAGASYKGQQKSQKNTYNIEVKIDDINWAHSNVCGSLRIRGLTEKNPMIETFFAGEIIGKKYSFLTRKWDVDFTKDQLHWSKFEEFKCFKNTFNDDDFDHSSVHESPVLFMRWKEQFCLPDHRIKDIEGASYEGFYYVALTKETGDIRGYYYAKDSEPDQLLTLQLEKKNSSSAFQFL